MRDSSDSRALSSTPRHRGRSRSTWTCWHGTGRKTGLRPGGVPLRQTLGLTRWMLRIRLLEAILCTQDALFVVLQHPSTPLPKLYCDSRISWDHHARPGTSPARPLPGVRGLASLHPFSPSDGNGLEVLRSEDRPSPPDLPEALPRSAMAGEPDQFLSCRTDAQDEMSGSPKSPIPSVLLVSFVVLPQRCSGTPQFHFVIIDPEVGGSSRVPWRISMS